MNSSPNNTNPYASPVPVKEDVPGYDLRKIARLYNWLGIVLKWYMLLVVIGGLLFMCELFLDRLELPDPFPDDQMPFLFLVAILKGMNLLIPPVCFIVYVLFFYSVSLIGRIAYAMQYRIIAMTLILIGACCFFGVNILVMFLLRRKAAQILRDGGVEITGGKVDLAKIPLENDY